MTTLFDSLQKKLNGDQDQALVPQQETLATALRAKSGKATTSTTPGASNLGEQSTLQLGQDVLSQGTLQGRLQGLQIGQAADAQKAQTDQAQANVEQNRRLAERGLATGAQIAGEQIAGQEQTAMSGLAQSEAQKVDSLNVSADQKLRQLASDEAISVDNIFRDRDRSAKELAFRKDAVELEQLGFLLAMRDKSYVDELSRIARERDLNDKMNYQAEMSNLILGDQLDRAMEDMAFKRDLNKDQRAWNEKLAAMDINAAIAFATATTKDEMRQQIATGVGNTAKGGIDWYYSGQPAATPAKSTYGTGVDSNQATNAETQNIG